MKTPGIGELRDRVLIRAWQEVPNAAMGSDPVYDDGVAAWGRVAPVGGTIYYGSQQTEEKVTHRITLRAGAVVTAAHVIDWNGRRFKVKRIMELGATRRFVTVDVEEEGIAT